MCWQYNRIADRVLELGFFPEKFRLVDFEPERSQGLRRMLVDNYSVFYVFKEELVTVTRVLYSASDIEKRHFVFFSKFPGVVNGVFFESSQDSPWMCRTAV